MARIKKHIRLFWAVLIGLFLLSGANVSIFANGEGSDLVINEFVASNRSGLIDEDGEYSDWIEIYNRSNSAVNLAGWTLTNDPNQPAKWFFPDLTLNSHEYLVVFASGKNRQFIQPGAALHTNFKLGKAGDFLGLYNLLESKFMDQFSPHYPEQFKDTAYGRRGEKQLYSYFSRPTPGGPNDEMLFWTDVVAPVLFSQQRGFYSTPFEVTLLTARSQAAIYYTTDGSEPTQSNGTRYTEPITIDTNTTLRAIALKAGQLPSDVATHTYIFADDVLTQPSDPAGFPISWGTQLVEDQGQLRAVPLPAQYAMNPQVVNDPAYQDDLKEALLSIPTMSLSTDALSLADLYLPGDRKGVEHSVSVEFFAPDGSESGFQINAGIRPYGNPEISKQSLRLIFKRKYGPTKLEYPLYDDSPVSQFDSLLLLAGEGDSFAAPNALDGNITYSRNAWLRASQLDMSNLGVHGRLVHLYLNGLYWGVYTLAERPDDSFMASYLGSEKEDWFVADQHGPLQGSPNNASDRLHYLFTLLNFAQQSAADELLKDGIYAELASAVDPVQFSDYLILNWYTGGASVGGWSAGIQRQNAAGRQGKTIIGDGYDIFNNNGAKISVDQTNSLLKPLSETLLEDPDFKILLADRLYSSLFNDGALTDDNARARWLRLQAAFDQVIVPELARWGSSEIEAALMRTMWLDAQEDVLTQMSGNAARLIAEAREAGLYPLLDAPEFSLDGGLVEAGFSVTMALPEACKGCAIYYTTDGSDPRLPVTGDLFPTAQAYDAPVVLTSRTQLKARTYSAAAADKAQRWSALHEATFSVMQQDSQLRLTELMYNPVGGDDYEYIELKNIGTGPANLANVSLEEGIRFTFPSNTPPLAPGEFAVLVSNPDAFGVQYPDVTITGSYEGHLSNKGEKVVLRDGESRLLLEFEYNDEYGWPVSSDGRGDSLILVNLSGDPNNPKNWRASSYINGSPGADEPDNGANDGEDKGI